jgi:hypothetical protein
MEQLILYAYTYRAHGDSKIVWLFKHHRQPSQSTFEGEGQKDEKSVLCADVEE